MKKIATVLLIIVLIFIFSCEKSDSEAQDPIVGKWEYSTQYENDIQITYNNCKRSTLEFRSNGTRNYLSYATNISGDCIVLDNIISTWEKTDTNTYKFKNNNGNSYSETVTFENGNKRLILQNFYFDENGNYSNYKFIYNRLY